MTKQSKREAAAVEAGRRAFRAELAATIGTAFDAFQAKASAAFARVQDEQNWKAPVDAMLVAPAFWLGFVLEAVVFFTGSVAEADKIGRGRWRVRAAGYYAAMGA